MVSIVPVITIAAAFAGVMWIERWQVRRKALQRGAERRRRWTLGLGADPFDPASAGLLTSIARAVVAADIAWIRQRTFDETRARQESPFQVRRSRVRAAIEGYANALRDVGRAATHWLESRPRETHVDRQVQHAVERLHEHLDNDGPDDLDGTIDLLESTRFRIGNPRVAPVDNHPFRG
jgi:hypothetical protein